MLEEKLLQGLVWDATKFDCEGGIREEPMEELISIQVHLIDPAKSTRIRAMVLRDAYENFEVFLRKNVDVFAWSYKDMLGINL